MQDSNFLYETTISKMNERKISRSNLRIDQPTVIMIVPDTNINLWNVIYNMGVLKSNCEGIVVPTKTFKLNNKNFIGKAHYLDIKKNLSVKKDKGKKFKISTKLKLKDVKTNDKKYWIYDLSLYSQALKYGNEKFTVLAAAKNFINQISSEYKILKRANPNIKFEMMFMVKNQEGYLFKSLEKYKQIFTDSVLESIIFYDNYCFMCNCDNTIVPIMYKEKGKNKLMINHLNKLGSYLNDESIEITKELNKESILQSDDKIEKEPTKQEKAIDEILSKKKDNFDNIIDDLKSVNLDTSNNKDNSIKIEINNRKLSKILKKYKVTDPDIVANVKASLDSYINQKGDKLTKDEAETIVFHAIHFSIYGTDKVRPEFLTHPEKLLEKIKDTRVHKTPLIFPSNLSENLINPKDVIDIKYTTGVWRQKDEFEKSIHKNVKKLFKTLENTTNSPVIVKDLTYKYVDDDLNRQIRYEVTLQNTGGGLKKPYKVYLNVPGVVNDRYMKLNGVPYIMPIQQFMKPVTKTVKDDVRVLSNYAILQLKLENVKFTPNDLPKIINYIQIKYPKLITKFNKKTGELKLSNKTILNIYENPVLQNNDRIINYDAGEQKLIDGENNIINEGKQEFIYNALIESVQTVNPKDQLAKTSNAIPYISIYLGGFKIPFIVYLWQQKGLLTTLNDFGIDYEINAKKSANDTYTIKTKQGYLVISPETRREKLICNGLLQLKVSKTFENVDEATEIHDVLNKIYGQRAVYNMNEMNENMIDVITKELLEFEGLPTNLNNLVSTHCVDVLLNSEVEDISDLKVYRARLSEMILNMMYSQIKMSHNEYRRKVLVDEDNAKINMYSDFIIDTIYEHNGILNYSENTNPIEEIFLASKTTKTGPQGIKNKQSFRKEHRNIHSSHIGNLGANASSESGNTGLDTAHTLNPAIINEYGGYARKDINTLGPFDSLAMNEALIPFINELDSDRTVMASTHAKQVTATNGGESPIIGTGAEYIVPQLSSRRFIQKAKKSGKVVEIVKDKYIKIEYKDGSTESFDTYPRLAKTYMASFLNLDMDTLEVGDKVTKNQPVAWTKNFDGNGMYCSGANAIMAIMNYNGMNHEDAYTITEKFSEKMNRDLIKEVSIVVPPEVKILNLEKIVGTELTKNDTLVEFQYDYGLDEYIDKYDIFDDNEFDEDDSVTDTMIRGGKNSIKLMGKQGVITDVKIYINTKNSVDKQIVSFHKKLVKDTKDIIGVLEESYSDENDKIKASDNIPLKFTKIGGHKLKGGAEFLGARIVYLIKQIEPLYSGDKLASRYAAKGVISSQIIPMDQIPTSKVHNLDIDTFISPTGVYSRKNVAMIKELYLGKVIYFLDLKIKEMSKDTKIKTNEIIKLVVDIYDLIGGEDSKKLIDGYFKNNTETVFRKRLKTDKNFKLFFPVVPFKKIEFEDIHKAADMIEVELDEYVYIPELKMTTKEKVPVGIMYMQVLEQTSQSYASIRSTGKYQSGTKQAAKGKN